MRTFILITLFIAGSCGSENGPGTRVGETRSFSPVVIDPVEKARIASICNSLALKTQQLSQANTQNYSFAVRQTGCTEGEGSLAPATGSPIAVSIVLDSSGHKIRRTDNGLPFVYPELETQNSGIMSTVCADLDEATSPILLDNGNSLWITTTQISATDCNPASNERCILLETGTPNGNSYQITTKEWIKFQIDPLLPNIGFFTERRTLTSALCALNQSSQTEAILLD